MTTDQNHPPLTSVAYAEATHHAMQMARLHEIYDSTGRREFALLFINIAL
jgi:hypothetical protein